MAMRYGGLGGLGGMPTSSVVRSDDEIAQEYLGRIQAASAEANAPDYTQANWANDLGSKMAEWLTPNNPMNPAVANYIYGNLMEGRISGMGEQFNNFAAETGYSGPTPYQIYKYDPAPRREQLLRDLTAASGDFAKIKQERAEASQRQATAYGQMQGGNYFGGMTTEGYSTPFSNQFATGGDGFGVGQSTPQGVDATNTVSAPGSFNSFGKPAPERQFRSGGWGFGPSWGGAFDR